MCMFSSFFLYRVGYFVCSPYIISPVAEAHLIRVLFLHDVHINQHIEMVTLIPRFPLSANSCAIVVSKTKQSEFIMAEETPSWIDLGVASHVNLRRWPFNSNLKQVKNMLILILLYLKGFNLTRKKLKILPVCKIFSLFSCANELNNGKKLLMAIKFFLFFQYQPKKYEKSIEP